jgi:hypothetical protein
VDSDTETLDFLNLEVALNLVQIVHLFQNLLSLETILNLLFSLKKLSISVLNQYLWDRHIFTIR